MCMRTAQWSHREGPGPTDNSFGSTDRNRDSCAKQPATRRGEYGHKQKQNDNDNNHDTQANKNWYLSKRCADVCGNVCGRVDIHRIRLAAITQCPTHETDTRQISMGTPMHEQLTDRQTHTRQITANNKLVPSVVGLEIGGVTSHSLHHKRAVVAAARYHVIKTNLHAHAHTHTHTQAHV